MDDWKGEYRESYAVWQALIAPVSELADTLADKFFADKTEADEGMND